MDKNEDIKDLWARYLANQCTVEEVRTLLLFVQSDENNPLAVEMIENGLDGQLPEKFLTHDHVDFILQDAFENIAARTIRRPQGKNIPFRFARYAAAAVLLLGLGWAGYNVFWRAASSSAELSKNNHGQLPVGINHAVLTLANGAKIKLNDASEEVLNKEYHLSVRKSAGAILYSATSEGSAHEFHTVATSKGALYKIQLADGTKVWLNAASSLKYPTAFNGKQREVELTGEGYFEVAKNADKPFYVKVNKMQIAVLGTIFNVNAYSNEKSVKTTLLEGSVKITNTGATGEGLVIRPGEQANFNATGELEKIEINEEDVIGWKQGVFRFSGNRIDLILRQISRWYDVELEYQGKVPDIEIAGEMPRNAKLEDIVSVLNASGLNIQILNKKLIVK